MFIVHKTFAMQKYAVIRKMTALTQATVSDSKYMAIIRTTLTFVTYVEITRCERFTKQSVGIQTKRN